LTDFNEIWHADGVRPSRPSLLVKILNLENSRWRRIYPEKSKNSHTLATVRANLARLCNLTLSTVPTVKNFEISKIQDGGGRHFENRHISTAVLAMLTKFGRVMQFGPGDHSVCYNLKFKDIQDGGGRHLRYLGNGLTDRHNIWHGDAYWPSKPDQQLKFRTSKNPRSQRAAILKNPKM